MLACFGILMASIAIIVIEAPELIGKNCMKEYLVFSLVLLAAAGLAFAVALRVRLPNPTDWAIAGLKPVSDWFDHLLQQ